MDYRFAIRCWQDQAGDENAKANVFVDGVQVATEVEITATSADSPQIIAWESTGLTAPAADTSFDIKVVLVNEYYVDANTDRNINIDGCGYLTKATDGNYKFANPAAGDPQAYIEVTITDFTDWDNYKNLIIPTAVTGDQIASDFWDDAIANSAFYTVTVWGGDAGATMTIPIINNTCIA